MTKHLNERDLMNEKNEQATQPLSPEMGQRIHAYWRAANYLSVGQIYLFDNPLLKAAAEARAYQTAAARALGHHAGTQLYLRASQSRDQEVRSAMHLYHRPRSWRSGHGRQCLSGGHLQRVLSQHLADEEGMKRLFKQFSFPGGIPSHVAPETSRVDSRGRRIGLFARRTPMERPSTIPICLWPA